MNSTAVLTTKKYADDLPRNEENGWHSADPDGKAKIKILAVDESNTIVDYLLWLSSDTTFGLGKHTHGGATYVYIIEGGYDLIAYDSLDDDVGVTTSYGPGDFLFQPRGQIHTEILGDKDVLLYASNRGGKDGTVFELYDESGSVVFNQKIGELAAMIDA